MRYLLLDNNLSTGKSGLTGSIGAGSLVKSLAEVVELFNDER